MNTNKNSSSHLTPGKPPKRPHGSSGSSLFSDSGPIGLNSGERGTLTLGDISSGHSPVQGSSSPAYAAPETMPPGQSEVRQEADAHAILRPERVAPSASTSWSPTTWQPRIDPESYVHPAGLVTGNVIIGKKVFISAGAVIRGDNEEPIYIGDNSNIQEGAVIKDLPTRRGGKTESQRVVDIGNEHYSLYISKGVSIAAQAQVHGPAYIADSVYIGMQSLVFWARIEKGVVIEPDCLVMNVTIPSGVFVPAGLKITAQSLVKDLPPLTSKYRFHGIADEMVESNLEMLEGYRRIMR